mgnify:FL=1
MEKTEHISKRQNLVFLSDCDVLEICDIWITYFEPKFRDLYNQTDLTSEDNSSTPIEEWIKNAELHKMF